MERIFIFLFLLFQLSPITTLAEANLASDMLQVQPLKYEEKMNLGEVKEGTIDIMNPSKQAETIQVETSSYRMANVTGQLEFYQSQNPNNFEKFVTVSEDRFVLPSGEGKKVTFRLGIPISAAAGGYYGAIFFRILPQETASDQSKAYTSGRVGTLFLITVGQGEVRQGEVRNFHALSNPFEQQSKFEFEQLNTSKYDSDPRGLYLKPTGTLTIKNIFGQTKAEQKVTGSYVLPETARKIQTELDNPYLFGLYKAELAISKYPGEPVMTDTITFVKFSPTVLAMIGFLALIIFIVMASLRPKLKRKKNEKSKNKAKN